MMKRLSLPMRNGIPSKGVLAGRISSLDQRAVTRIVLALVTVIGVLFALWVSRQSPGAPRIAISAAATAATQTLEQFAATWRANVARSAEQVTVTWTVSNAQDLRASLLAFDATQSKSPRITVTRRDASFAVSAEVAP